MGTNVLQLFICLTLIHPNFEWYLKTTGTHNMRKFCLILGLNLWLVFGNPTPIDEEKDEYEDYGMDVCLTSADSEAPEAECVFPFTFNNFTYYGCPTDPVDETKRWCSIKTDENGVHVEGEGTWGYCTVGCKPEIFPDELLIGSDAKKDVQTETCDFTACNGFTYKLDVFDKVETYGECQYPAGKNGRDDDFFCFVNEDSACYKVAWGEEEVNLFIATTPCKDPNAPVSRGWFGYRRSFGRGSYGGFYGSNRRSYNSYGRGRYSSGGYRGNSYGGYGNSYGGYSSRRRYGSSYNSGSRYGNRYGSYNGNRYGGYSGYYRG